VVKSTQAIMCLIFIAHHPHKCNVDLYRMLVQSRLSKYIALDLAF